ncbi:MAG TPA: hypothetical protein VMJ34_18315 [Bryobacteraceae bacterium]|nr:hypothetical protein [Bryobacteraceae bacterium]
MTKSLFAAATLLLTATTISAQGYKYLTSVATFKVAPGKEAAFVEKGKAFIPALDKLMADGTVIGYGIDVDMLHVPGENNVSFWVEVPNYGALAKSDEAIDAFIKANPALMQEIGSLTDMSAHHDLVIRTQEGAHNAIPAGVQPVEDFDMVRVKPGHGEDFMTLSKKYDKPVLDKLVADGVIYAYEMDAEAVHTMEPGLVWLIVTMPDLGTKDKVNAAFDEAEKAMSEGERKIVEKAYQEAIVPGSHRDSLATSVVFKMK